MSFFVSVIDWGFESTQVPTVFAAKSLTDLERQSAEAITGAELNEASYAAFIAEYPLNADDPKSVTNWLLDLRDEVTAPWITFYRFQSDGLTEVQQGEPIPLDFGAPIELAPGYVASVFVTQSEYGEVKGRSGGEVEAATAGEVISGLVNILSASPVGLGLMQISAASTGKTLATREGSTAELFAYLAGLSADI